MTGNDTTLLSAAKNGDEEVVRRLLAAGAHPNLQDTKGETPLHWASYYSYKEVALLLLAAGTNLHTQDYRDKTPRDRAPPVSDVRQPLDEAWHANTALWHAWQRGELLPEQVNSGALMKILTVWPLDNPRTPVPWREHMEAFFGDERWDGHEAQKLNLIQEIPALTAEDRLHLMGGPHIRTLLRARTQSHAPTEEMGR